MKAILILISYTYCFFSSFGQGNAIVFEHTQSMEEIKKIAHDKKKQIFINVYGYIEANSPSQWMVEDVFTDKSVADYYNQHFVCANFDLSYGGNNDLKNKYDAGQFPVYIFLDENGELMHRACWGMSIPQFINLGKVALDKEKRFSFYEKGYAEGNREPQFLRNYMKLLFDACLGTQEVIYEYWKTQKENELNSRENWDVLIKYETDPGSVGFQNLIKNFQNFASRYTKDSVDTKIYFTILYKGKEMINKDDFTPRQIEELLNIVTPIAQETKVQLVNHFGFLKAEKFSNWAEYGMMAIDYCEKYHWNDAQELNAVAWKIFENTDDTVLLNSALKWSGQSVERQKGVHQYHDTYAALLYKLNRFEEAETSQQRAISLAREVGASEEDIQDYFNRIENIKTRIEEERNQKLSAELSKKAMIRSFGINDSKQAWACESSFILETDYRYEDGNENYMRISEIQNIYLNPLQILLEFLFDAAINGKAKSFRSIFDLEDQKITDSQYYLKIDTVIEIDTETNKENKFVSPVFKKEYCSAIGINQEWYFDQKEKKIKVKINDIELIYNQEMMSGYGRPMCYFSLKQRENEIFPVPSTNILSLPELIWASRFSIYFYSDTLFNEPQIPFRQPLKTMFGTDLPALLFTLIKSGQVSAFSSPESITPLTIGEITQMTTMRDTMAQEDPYNGNIIYSVNEWEIKAAQVKALKVVQQWHFNKEKFQLESKIRWLEVLRTKVNGMGENTGYEPLFWIKFE